MKFGESQQVGDFGRGFMSHFAF